MLVMIWQAWLAGRLGGKGQRWTVTARRRPGQMLTGSRLIEAF